MAVKKAFVKGQFFFVFRGSDTISQLKCFILIEKAPPDGVAVSMIFGIENHRYPSYYDLHIKMFHSAE